MKASDRTGLERLCRYILRPPLANDRLKWTRDGRVSVRLKRPWSDGTTHLVLPPQELVAKLVPLVPAPRFNRLRYHGVFAPNAKLRSRVVPARKEAAPCAHAEADAVDDKQEASDGNYRSRYSWSRLMARVFEIDVLSCPKCSSRMQRISFITTADAIRKILSSVGFAADSPEQPVPVPAGQIELLSA